MYVNETIIYQVHVIILECWRKFPGLKPTDLLSSSRVADKGIPLEMGLSGYNCDRGS